VRGALAVFRLARPFTLIAPALGMVSGALVGMQGLRLLALDAAGNPVPLWRHFLPEMLAGAALAMLLNAASNAVNQIFDIEVDRVNKPTRPLPAGELSIAGAWAVTVVAGAAALGIAWTLPPPTFAIVAFTAAVVYSYSGPPLRTKRFWWAANPTIAIPRGTLLFVAGWTSVLGWHGLGTAEPWLLGGMYGLFVLGAATTKDYADIRGDRKEGCITLPIRFGVRRSVWITVPFLVLPWFALPAGAALGLLSADGTVLSALGAGLAVWGAYVAALLLRNPDDLTTAKTHPSWQHMYLMLVGSQVGVAAAYWVR